MRSIVWDEFKNSMQRGKLKKYKKIMMTDHIVSEEELPDEELPRVKMRYIESQDF